MHSVGDLLVKQRSLQIPKCGAHRLKTLPHLFKHGIVALKLRLVEAGFQQPGLEMPPVPGVECDLLDVELVEQRPDVLRNIFVIDRLARRRHQVSVAVPQVIWHPVNPRLVRQIRAWQPECRLDVPYTVHRGDQHQRRQVSGLRQIEATIDGQTVEAGNDIGAAGLPHRLRHEWCVHVDALVEDQVAVLRLPARHAPGILRHRLCFDRVLEISKGRVGRPHRLDGERVHALISGVEAYNRARIGPLHCVVDQHRQQIGIRRRLRRYHDRQRVILRASCRLKRLVQFRARPLHLPELVVDDEHRRKAVCRRRIRRERSVECTQLGAIELLAAVPDADEPATIDVEAGVHANHLRRQREQDRCLVPRLRGREQLRVWPRLRAAQMQQQ